MKTHYVGLLIITITLIFTQVNSHSWNTKENHFQTIFRYCKEYVDKSLLIKEILENDHKVIIITRPAKWGKSLNLDMLNAFLGVELDSRGNMVAEQDKIHGKLFAGGEIDFHDSISSLNKTVSLPLKIAQYEDIMIHQGKHPIIKIDLERLYKPKLDDLKSVLFAELHETFTSRRYLQEYIPFNKSLKLQFEKYHKAQHIIHRDKITREELADSFRFASEILYEYHKQRSYVLVDNYERPFLLKPFQNSSELVMTMELLSDVYRRMIHNNPYIEKAIFTDVLKLRDFHEMVFSEIDILEDTILEGKFSKYYGFQDHEIDALMAQAPERRSCYEKIVNLCKTCRYDGILYNPFAVRYILNDLKKDAYSLSTTEYGQYFHLPFYDSIPSLKTMHRDIQILCTGETILYSIPQITCHNISSPISLPNQLLFYGYLNPVAKQNGNEVFLNIPNDEMKTRFYFQLQNLLRDEFNTSLPWLLLTDAFYAGELHDFEKIWQNYAPKIVMNKLYYNSVMIALWNSIRKSSNFTHNVEFSMQRSTGTISAIIVPNKNAVRINGTAIIVMYQFATHKNNTRFQAMECAKVNDSLSSIDKIKKYPHVGNIMKTCLVFSERNVVVGHAEEIISRNCSKNDFVS